MHLYLERMEDIDSTACYLAYCAQEHIYLRPYVLLTRNYASNHRSRAVWAVYAVCECSFELWFWGNTESLNHV